MIRRIPRPLLPLLGAVTLAALLAGCAAPAPDAPATSAAPAASSLGAGFLGDTPPSPEATITPEAGSWAGIHPPAGYRVVLITRGDDAPTGTLVSAVGDWAAREAVDLQTLTATTDDEVEDRIDEAVALEPDLVIGAGDQVIDVFMLLTAQHLAQQFLVVGAELPEPTENVTSVIWPGAAFRGTGLGVSGEIDPASFTPERAGDAVDAGVASVLHGHTGIVVSLP